MNRLVQASLLAGSILLFSCGSADQGAASPPADNAQGAAAEEAKDAETPSAEEVAVTFLKAYRDKDLETLRKLSVPAMAIYFTEENPDLDQALKEDVLEGLKAWDGKIGEIRVGKDKWTGMEIAVVPYADRPRSEEGEMLAVLTLDRIAERWLFGIHDFSEVSRKEFEEVGSREP